MFRPCPQFADHVFATRTDEASENERDDDRVVELAGDRDEVRNEIERQRQVANQREQKQLASAGHAWVTREPGDKHPGRHPVRVVVGDGRRGAKVAAVAVTIGLAVSIIPILLRVLPPLARDIETNKRDPNYAVTVSGLLAYVAIVAGFLVVLDID